MLRLATTAAAVVLVLAACSSNASSVSDAPPVRAIPAPNVPKTDRVLASPDTTVQDPTTARSTNDGECTGPEIELFFLTRADIRDRYPVVDAAMNGTLKETYAQDPTLDLQGYVVEEPLSPLLYAIRRHCNDLFDWLVEAGAIDTSARVLRFAVSVDNTHALSVLLAAGGDPESDDGTGGTLIYYTKSADVVALLAEAGADLEHRHYSSRPIDSAALSGLIEVVTALFPLTSNPSTAIYSAVRSSQLDALLALRDLGADVDYPLPAVGEGLYERDRNATDIFDVARVLGDPDVISLLEQWVNQ